MLEINHRVVVADRGFEEAFRIVRGRRRDDLEPGAVHKPRFRVLGVIQAAADVAAARGANDDRHRRAAAVPVAQRRRLVDDLVEAARDEVGELHFGDRSIASQRCADADPDNRRLGDRRVEHTHLAELVEQPLRGAERAAVRADVLAEDEDLRVAAHFFGERLADCIEIREFL